MNHIVACSVYSIFHSTCTVVNQLISTFSGWWVYYIVSLSTSEICVLDSKVVLVMIVVLNSTN